MTRLLPLLVALGLLALALLLPAPVRTAAAVPANTPRIPAAEFASVLMAPVPPPPGAVESVQAVAPASTPTPPPLVSRTGVVSTYGPGFEGYAALPRPWGSGWRFTVCGPGGCRTLVSNDTGPDQRRHPDRIADLDVATFEAVCGVRWRMGLCVATVTVEGREP